MNISALPKYIPALNSKNTTIKRYAQIDNTLYRGSCPVEEQFKELKEQGFKWVISLRSGFDEKGRIEKEIVERLGMKYKNFPVDSRFGPDKNVVSDFFTFMDNVKEHSEPVFMHCKHGRDRTGTFTALYEIRNKIKSVEGAVRELFAFGYNFKKHPEMLDFIEKFTQTLK